MSKPIKKPRPSPPHWYWADSDNCWQCKDKTKCNRCKVLKELDAKQREKRERREKVQFLQDIQVSEEE